MTRAPAPCVARGPPAADNTKKLDAVGDVEAWTLISSRAYGSRNKVPQVTRRAPGVLLALFCALARRILDQSIRVPETGAAVGSALEGQSASEGLT